MVMSRAFLGSFERLLLSDSLKRILAALLSGQIYRKSSALKPQIAEISETVAFGVSNLLLDVCLKSLTCEQWAYELDALCALKNASTYGINNSIAGQFAICGGVLK